MPAKPCKHCRGTGWFLDGRHIDYCPACRRFSTDEAAVRHLADQTKACQDITDTLTACEWDSSTVSRVADILRAAGHNIADPEGACNDA